MTSSPPDPSHPAQIGQLEQPGHFARAGAHRPRRPRWHEFLPVIGVVLVVLVLVVGFFELKGSVLGGSSAGKTTNGPSDDDNGPVPTGPTGSATTKAATSTASATATSTATSTSSSGSVSHSIKISVFNGTTRTGLAKGAAGKLTSAGWTKASIGGNKTGYTGSTTVFYASSAQRASAQAVAKDLGGYTTQESSQYGSSGLTVVLGSDYNS